LSLLDDKKVSIIKIMNKTKVYGEF